MLPFEPEVRRFIIDSFLFGEERGDLSVHDSLLEKGLIDSTGILELVGFVQDTFGVRIEDHEIIPANLDSISKIAEFISRKKGHAGGDGQPNPV
jgi:acyl carrier protein